MRGGRRIAQALGVVVCGYGGYTAAVQIETSRQINQRKVLKDETERYAPMKILGRYVNPFPEYRHQTLFEFGYRRISELLTLTGPGHLPESIDQLEAALPRFKPEFTNNFTTPHKMAVTWIGQSCTLTQLPGNLTILTDPMFSDYVVSPRVGPQRLVPPPCTPSEIPQPDVVLVSHDHQDHLDLESIPDLTKKGTTWVVPQGVQKHLPSHAECIEMSWWEKIPMPNADPKLGYEIACTPAMHWSGRALYDSNTTLWCSFLILQHGKPLLYHGGDTGYSEGMFKAIGKVYGPGCDVAIIPCGAYYPRWHLHAQHMAPFESLKTMHDLGAKKMVGVHWGTFIMSEEPFNEPPKLLKELASNENNEKNVIAPQLGKTIEFDI